MRGKACAARRCKSAETTCLVVLLRGWARQGEKGTRGPAGRGGGRWMKTAMGASRRSTRRRRSSSYSDNPRDHWTDGGRDARENLDGPQAPGAHGGAITGCSISRYRPVRAACSLSVGPSWSSEAPIDSRAQGPRMSRKSGVPTQDSKVTGNGAQKGRRARTAWATVQQTM